MRLRMTLANRKESWIGFMKMMVSVKSL